MVGHGGRVGTKQPLTLWLPLRWAVLRSSGRCAVVRGVCGCAEPGQDGGGMPGRSPPSYSWGSGGRGGTESDSYRSKIGPTER